MQYIVNHIYIVLRFFKIALHYASKRLLLQHLSLSRFRESVQIHFRAPKQILICSLRFLKKLHHQTIYMILLRYQKQHSSLNHFCESVQMNQFTTKMYLHLNSNKKMFSKSPFGAFLYCFSRRIYR